MIAKALVYLSGYDKLDAETMGTLSEIISLPEFSGERTSLLPEGVTVEAPALVE